MIMVKMGMKVIYTLNISEIFTLFRVNYSVLFIINMYKILELLKYHINVTFR